MPSNFIVTPNMNLPNPVPTVDPGPDYAFNLQSCVNIVDQHNHSPGQGIQITPNGININTDLPFNVNNAISLRTTRFTPQTATLSGASDIGCLYVVNNELYYNDATGGNKIQITSNGSVNATSSGISSGTATAAFSAGTLVVKSSSTSFANVDVQSIVLANSGNLVNQLTLQAPTLSGSTVITMPNIPASNAPLIMDNSGNISANVGLYSAFCPTGVVLPYAGASAPTGWLIADGSAISRSTYATLFTLISTTYGSGDGSTTFNIPNMAGNIPVGVGGTIGAALGGTGGEAAHTLSTAEIPSHTHHTVVNTSPAHNPITSSSGISVNQDGLTGPYGQIEGGSSAPGLGITDGGNVGGGSHNNVQPYLCLNYIIKT